MPMTYKAVDAFARSLPNVTVGARWNHKTWMVSDKGFAWERALGKSDIDRFGESPVPTGEIIAVVVENLDAKDAVLAMSLPGFFTIQHFNGYAAVLIELRKARAKDVQAALRDAHRVVSAKAASKVRAARPRNAARVRQRRST
jgi:hypothetical protein